jgi:uncharacterized membrane protein
MKLKLKIKTEHVIASLLAIIIIFPVRLPQYINELLQNILGKVILIGIGTSLFFYNPIVGSLALVAAYVLLQRSRREGLEEEEEEEDPIVAEAEDMVDEELAAEEIDDDELAEEEMDDDEQELAAEAEDNEVIDTEDVEMEPEDVVEGMANKSKHHGELKTYGLSNNTTHTSFEEECVHPKPVIGKVTILHDDKVNNLRSKKDHNKENVPMKDSNNNFKPIESSTLQFSDF